MKQTNFHLFDFLDFNPDLNDDEILWKACKPVNIEKLNNDIIITIPFQKQKYSKEISPDNTVSPKNYHLRIRGYGEKILRISSSIRYVNN